MKTKGRKLIFDEKGLKAFGAHLKKVRESKGISQEKLAYKCNLAQSSIARIEKAKINPTLSTIFEIIRGLNISAHELFLFKLP